MNKCNIDINGKATIVDPDNGRPENSYKRVS